MMSAVGTKRTTSDVRSSVANGGRADMVRTAQFGQNDPQQNSRSGRLFFRTAHECAASRRSVCDRRQGELKAGAAGQVRARPQASAVRVDDRTADRQAHPQTVRLRRVEGLENVLDIRRGEAWTRISHLD